MSEPICVSPVNPHVLEYEGKPITLLCASEHYGAVINRPFDYRAYLDDCRDKKQNYTRTFLLFRELQTSNNPFSPCKPDSPDYISPFKRVGPEKAADGEPKYDLDQWNEEFFERLRGFVSAAREAGVIVEVVLFSCSYADHLFDLIPVSPKNNINDVEDIRFHMFLTTNFPKMFGYQKKYVEKVVTELNRYPNVIYELCNEPLAFEFDEGSTSVEEVNRWLAAIAGIIRETEKHLPYRHLIAAEEAWHIGKKGKLTIGLDHTFEMDADIVNVHPAHMTYRGNVYDAGEFMIKERHNIAGLRALCLDARKYGDKPVTIDEDNNASCYRDYVGWTIHRKRAWTTILCGANYDYIDFSIQALLPAGTPDSRAHIRTWFSYLQTFAQGMDLKNGEPCPEIVLSAPENTISSALGVAGKEYHIYIADARETADPGYGEAIEGSLKLELAPGEYHISAYSPEFGGFSPALAIGGGQTEIWLPSFVHDVALSILAR